MYAIREEEKEQHATSIVISDAKIKRLILSKFTNRINIEFNRFQFNSN